MNAQAKSKVAPGVAVRADAAVGLADLVRAHTPYIWRVLRSLGVAEHDVADVCQETFLVVHRRIDSFEGRSALKSWLYGVAVRVAADYRGRAYRRHESPAGEPSEQACEPSQESGLERRDAWRRIDRLLEPLSEDQRHVFVLYEIGELSMRQVAETVDCPLQTAYSRLWSARKLIQQRLAELRASGASS